MQETSPDQGLHTSKSKFFSNLYLFIDDQVEKLECDKSYLTYFEFKKLTNALKKKFQGTCQVVPKEIEIACTFAEAVMSPTKNDTIKALKNIVLIAGGGGGIALMLPAIGAILGWGTGVVGTVMAFFVGVNMVPIVGQIAVGVGVAAIATYFYFHEESPESKSERGVKVLKTNINKVEDAVWEKMKRYDLEDNFWFS